MTCADIQAAIAGHSRTCLWSPQKALAVRNSSGIVGWEADLLIVQPSGWVWEVEVKVSVSDFRREFTAGSKIKKHTALTKGEFQRWAGSKLRQNMVRKFFYAMPSEVYEKVKSEVPEYAGVILVAKEPGDYGRLRPRIERNAKVLPARRANDKDRTAILLSVYHRYWRLKPNAFADCETEALPEEAPPQ